jgi:hypothetical protein
MSNGLLILDSILDEAKALVLRSGLDAGWSVHFKELTTVDDDQLPAVVIWILDDTTEDATPMVGSSHIRKSGLVFELRAPMGITGSIVKTLSPVANKIYCELCKDESMNGLLSSLSFRTMNTVGDSQNPKYCGMTLHFEAEYLFEVI